jgi:ABC-type multidrug transport system ATPase subunit
MQEPTLTTPPSLALHTKGLSRSYGKITALSGLDLDVPHRSVFGFLGPNGAGKTTAIRCVLGLIRANSGSVKINGHDLKRARSKALRGVGAVVETPALYPNLTGRENLELTRLMIKADPASIDWVLELVNMTESADRRVGHYSLGMKQRLGIARAMMGKPNILILDEPLNGLDPAGIRDMRDLIRSLPQRENTTVFMSSHLLAEVEQVADHVALMKDGRTVYQGNLAALIAQHAGKLCIHMDRTEDGAIIAGEQGFTVSATTADSLLVALSPNDTKERLAALNRALVSAGISVSQLFTEPADLETIFMSLTSVDGSSGS